MGVGKAKPQLPAPHRSLVPGARQSSRDDKMLSRHIGGHVQHHALVGALSAGLGLPTLQSGWRARLDKFTQNFPPTPTVANIIHLRTQLSARQPQSCLTRVSGTRARAPTARALAAGTISQDRFPPARSSRIEGFPSRLTCHFSLQPRLQAQGWSDPQVRPQPVPSMLP